MLCVDFTPRTRVRSSQSFITVAPEATTVKRPSLMLSRSVALTPRKQFSPMSQLPETTTCELMKQWLRMVEWCPMWLPYQSVTSSPMVTKGWMVLSSRMKQLSPTGVP